MEPAEYPKSAMQAEDEGTVSVLITIDERGAVIDARVIRTDASEPLQLAAVEAAKKWTFRPASLRGVPVQVEVEIPFRFTLSN